MNFPRVTAAEWRALVEKELAGVPFEKLVHTTAEGLKIQPLYTERSVAPAPPGVAPFVRGVSATPPPALVCTRWDGHDVDALDDELGGGADALWLLRGADFSSLFARARQSSSAQSVTHPLFLVVEIAQSAAETMAAFDAAATANDLAPAELRLLLANDPLAAIARGERPAATARDAIAGLARDARAIAATHPEALTVQVSTLPVHDAGGDAADELAVALSTGAAYLSALLDAGFTAHEAAQQLAVQIAVGRDTFGELCKLRALRLCWHKLFAAVAAPGAPLALLHAVGSARTTTTRDPWVNMLRATTQLFSAMLGGATLVTPTAYDDAAGTSSRLGRRVARNTGLVLREESQLGRVVDPAGGSYYLETLTDALAREAWRRFRALEADGGIVATLANGGLRARLAAAWDKRRDGLVKRKDAIVGVSEFANLNERLERAAVEETRGDANAGALPRHRDAEPFETLRDREDALAAAGYAPRVAIVTLGPPAEHRARVGFAAALLAAGGLRASTVAAEAAVAAAPRSPVAGSAVAPTAYDVACLCGSDERYATDAAEVARALKRAGVRRVILAGRGGALEAELRAAGVDDFIFMGGDVVASLAAILEVTS